MFNVLTDALDNALAVVGDLADGELPPRRRVAQLLADGLTVAAVSAATGYAVDVVERIAADVTPSL